MQIILLQYFWAQTVKPKMDMYLKRVMLSFISLNPVWDMVFLHCNHSCDSIVPCSSFLCLLLAWEKKMSQRQIAVQLNMRANPWHLMQSRITFSSFNFFLSRGTSILLEKILKSEEDKGPNIFLNGLLYMWYSMFQCDSVSQYALIAQHWSLDSPAIFKYIMTLQNKHFVDKLHEG